MNFKDKVKVKREVIPNLYGSRSKVKVRKKIRKLNNVNKINNDEDTSQNIKGGKDHQTTK